MSSCQATIGLPRKKELASTKSIGQYGYETAAARGRTAGTTVVLSGVSFTEVSIAVKLTKIQTLSPTAKRYRNSAGWLDHRTDEKPSLSYVEQRFALKCWYKFQQFVYFSCCCEDQVRMTICYCILPVRGLFRQRLAACRRTVIILQCALLKILVGSAQLCFCYVIYCT